MKPAQIKILTSSLPAFISVMIRGPHGIGKSSVVAQIAKDVSLPLVDRRLSQMTEGDMIGLPSTDGGVTRFNPPDWIARACREGVLLFLDELNRATAEVIQAAFQLCNDRCLNGNVLHPDTRVFCAINDGSSYQVNELDPALLDRFFVVDYDIDADSWLAWAKLAGVASLVCDFIAAQPNALMPTAVEAGRVSPSPRSWERLSISMKKFGIEDDPESPLFYSLAAGFVGPDTAQAFHSFAKKFDNKLEAKDIIEHGDREDVQKKIDKATPEKHMLLIEQIVGWIEMQDVQDDDVPGSKDGFTEEMAKRVRHFYERLTPENRVTFHVKMMATAEKPSGVKQLPKIVEFHKNTVDLLLEVFGTKVGEAGVGIEPRIPEFLRKDAA